MDNLPTLQETMLSILKDHTRQLMDYQRLIARFPITDTSIEAMLVNLVQYQRDLKAGKADLRAFKQLIHDSHFTQGLVSALLFEDHNDALLETVGENTVMMLKSNVSDWADEMNAPDIKLVS